MHTAAPTDPRERKVVVTFLAALAVAGGAAYGLVGPGRGLGVEPRGRGGQRPVVTTSTAPTTTTTTRQPIAYRVQRGDTLTGIARRFGVTIEAVVAANRLTDLDHLGEGQALTIPPPPPTAVTASPGTAAPGEPITLTLTGAGPGESIVFEVRSPVGSYVGPPHTATADGTATATYRPSSTATPGTYTVVARGDRGTEVQATFRIGAA